MMPSEKAMAETLSNLTQETPQENLKSIQEVEYEDIDLAPPSATALNKDIQMEDKVLDDEHSYEEIKDPSCHEYEEVDKDNVPKPQEEGPPSTIPCSSLQTPIVMGKETVDEEQNSETEIPHKEETEESASEEADPSVTAIDEEEEVGERKPMAHDDEETVLENREFKLEEDIREDDVPRAKMEIEPHPSSSVEELKEEDVPSLPFTQSSSSASSAPSSPASLTTPHAPSTPPPPSTLLLSSTSPSPTTPSPPSTPPTPSAPTPPSAPPPPSIPPPSSTPILSRAGRVVAAAKPPLETQVYSKGTVFHLPSKNLYPFFIISC